MVAKILSVNIGGPAQMEWQGKSILSSMLKHPVPGPIKVLLDRVEGNTFANPQAHGAIHSVLYAFGIPSAQLFADRLGIKSYVPGSTGETLTLDQFDETEISVGDVFEIGEVIAQATYPRIPCGKVSYRMQNKDGQQAMIDCGRSGVYFRILKPGLISATDLVKRTKQSQYPFKISRLYQLIVSGERPTPEEFEIASNNPAFVAGQIKRWEQA